MTLYGVLRGRAYYRRKLAAGKTPMEAMRCLKRRLSDIVYRQMVADAKRLATGPEGHVGATLKSSAADPNPHDRHFGKVTSRTRHTTA
jgi:transposase